MGRSLWDLVRREDGVVAVIFAVMAIPFIAMAGWAVDYVRLQHVQEKLQIEADSAALNALIEDVDWEVVHDAAMAEIARNYNGSWAREVQVEGEWLNQYDFRVTASADVPLAFIKLLPGIGDVQRVSVAAVAQVERPDLKWVAPEFSELSYEAADFNRLWLYCYWIDRPEGDPSQPKRTQMVPIADNGGSSANRDLRFVPDPGDPADPDNPIVDPWLRDEYARRTALLGPPGLDTSEQGVWRQISGGSGAERRYTYLMPQCPQGSFLSIRLENVRNSRTSPQRWDAGGSRYNYYTESEWIPGSPEKYHGLEAPSGQKVTILETILCDTLEECRRTPAQGGKIPPNNSTNRTPQQATEECGEDKFMYYGWEDRPPEIAGSDRDYDDIRIVMACPEQVSSGERNARLLS
ncbi:TadE/TadG family type IV pilus assembly protein [Pelagibacterium sp.]|uniref:TadE/TadG family type IV pilus assembly protein n=1 Tax=Pelagibacterium sp. TaxID=1967288 RepID=UPI003BAC3096